MDAFKFFPSFLRRHLSDSPNRQQIVANSGWLIADKALRMLVGLIVGVLVARYLGPHRFGLLNYALAFCSLFAALAGLGLENIVIRELVKNPGNEGSILGTVFWLQTVAGGLTWGLAAFVLVTVPQSLEGVFWLVVVVSASFLFNPFGVVVLYFRSRIEARYIFLGRIGSFLLISSLKLFFIFTMAPVFFFATAFTLEVVFNALGLVWVYKMQGGRVSGWRYDGGLARKALSESWPLIISGFSVMVYMRIDQIMLGFMRGSVEVGLYSAAVRISEIWYFIPVFFVQSAFPIIVRSREEDEATYHRRLQNMFSFMCLLSYMVIIPVTLFSSWMVNFLYGAAYQSAAAVVAVHVWAGLFVAFGVVQGSWLVNEGLTRLSLYRGLMGASTNVALNFLLIPEFGIMGAAVSTVISYAVAGTLSNIFFPVARPILRMQLKGLACVFEKDH